MSVDRKKKKEKKRKKILLLKKKKRGRESARTHRRGWTPGIDGLPVSFLLLLL